jgi:hypothetical protein
LVISSFFDFIHIFFILFDCIVVVPVNGFLALLSTLSHCLHKMIDDRKFAQGVINLDVQGLHVAL